MSVPIKDYPDYQRGTLDKGFILIGVYERNFDQLVNAGFVGTITIYAPSAGEFVELLSLLITSDWLPANPPSVYDEFVSVPVSIHGIETALTNIPGINDYQLDLRTQRITCYGHTTGITRLRLNLPANLANNTTFKVRGIYAIYGYAT